MTRSRYLPALLTLLLAAGAALGQKVPSPNYLPPGALPYAQQSPEVLPPPRACDDDSDGDMVSLLVADCLKTWALLWDNGRYTEAGMMANEACRLQPSNPAAEYARVLSQLANHTRLVHPAAGCPYSCTAVPAATMTCAGACNMLNLASFTPFMCSEAEECDNPVFAAAVCANGGPCTECTAKSAAKKTCACGAKPVSVKKPCCCKAGCCDSKPACACDSGCCQKTACKSNCCSVSDACACRAECCADANSCACQTKCKCCSTKQASSCCKNCVKAKQSCSCCTNCSCSKNSTAGQAQGDAANCAFLRMLQGQPHVPGQPSHPIVIMNPVATPGYPGMHTGFLPPMPQPLVDIGHPGMPMIIPPPAPRMDGSHDHMYIPVVRPPLPPPLTRDAEQEMAPQMAPPPPPMMPSMPLQITAAGKRVKVSCPRFEARCDRISHLPSGERILLEGNVRLTFRGKNAGKVSCERVEVDTMDGAVEVNPPPVPPRPVVPVGYYSPMSQVTPMQTAPRMAPDLRPRP